jgi:hypothetical protein
MIGSDKKLRDMIAAETAKAESRIVEKKKK